MTVVDGAGNVIIREPATTGMPGRPGVVLQAHLDMVPQKTTEATTNFGTDPIKAVVDDGWVHADGTTLGADDALGVAPGAARVLVPERGSSTLSGQLYLPRWRPSS